MLRVEPGSTPAASERATPSSPAQRLIAVLRFASALRVRGRAFGRRKWLLRRRGWTPAEQEQPS
jgi:hypothetical protein